MDFFLHYYFVSYIIMSCTASTSCVSCELFWKVLTFRTKLEFSFFNTKFFFYSIIKSLFFVFFFVMYLIISFRVVTTGMTKVTATESRHWLKSVITNSNKLYLH